jgi:hypothetical protein
VYTAVQGRETAGWHENKKIKKNTKEREGEKIRLLLCAGK